MTASDKSSKKDSLESYLEARSHLPAEFTAGWLVRTPRGDQFSVHLMEDRDRADASAERTGGTVERYTPTTSTYWKDEGPHYDH